MITVAWTDSVTSATETFTISDDVMASLESYRLTLTDPKPTAEGNLVQMPRYANFRDMVVGIFILAMVQPAMSMFPPPSVVDAIAQAKAAQAALEAARIATLQGVLGPASGQ